MSAAPIYVNAKIRTSKARDREAQSPTREGARRSGQAVRSPENRIRQRPPLSPRDESVRSAARPIRPIGELAGAAPSKRIAEVVASAVSADGRNRLGTADATARNVGGTSVSRVQADMVAALRPLPH
jgi:hypothetical protein